MRRVRRRVLDGPRSEANFVVYVFPTEESYWRAVCGALLPIYSAQPRRAEADPALTNWAREGAKAGGQHLTGEDGGGAAAAAGWLVAAAVTAVSADGWMSSHADFVESCRLLAVPRGRPRTLLTVQQYSHRISTHYGSVGNPDPYDCTAVREI